MTTPRLPIERLLRSARTTILFVGLFLAGTSLFFSLALPRWLPDVEESVHGAIIRHARLAVGVALIGIALALPRFPGRLALLALMLTTGMEGGVYAIEPRAFHWGESLLPTVVVVGLLLTAWNQARSFEILRSQDKQEDSANTR